MNIVSRRVPPSHLLLDPNNYRFHDIAGYKRVPTRARYGETGVQERALQLLQNTESFDLSALKDSILTNSFVPLEQIVVEEFDSVEEQTRYLVIEGNRRVAAVKTLLADQAAGAADPPENVLASMRELPVAVLQGTEDERRSYQQTLMAIRHVAGIREWGPYQQARLVVELYEGGHPSFTSVAQRIGISSREVARRYRASKALEQMEQDDEFGDYAAPRLYSFFHEAVSQPKVRDWLKLSDVTFKAEDADARRAFYELLSPRTADDGTSMLPKLQNANRQVRQLKDIVDKQLPLKKLLDPEVSFDEAVKAAEVEALPDEVGVLEHSIALALQALRTPSIEAWFELSEAASGSWSELLKLVDNIRKHISDPDNYPAPISG